MKPWGSFLLCLAACAPQALAQRNTGEVRLRITDPLGNPVSASGELRNQSAQYIHAFTTTADGRYLAKSVPFGLLVVRVASAGFAPYEETIEVRSEIPRELRVAMGMAPLETTVTVREDAVLIDPHATGSPSFVGAQTMREQPQAQPGRTVLEAVNAQPGWLLEANGVLHPRGSEYQTQFVLDGLPVTDNRSPAFAPAIEADDVESMTVLTANFPAEYGRKLGGVIEIRSADTAAPGPHVAAMLGGGSFATQTGFAGVQYAATRTSGGLAAEGAMTDRYLDPPVLENFTNHANAAGMRAHLEHTFSDSDRVWMAASWNRAGFLVPNERIQELAGQRQDRSSAESIGRLSWQHIFSPALLLNVRGMVRDLSAELYSNPAGTPILPAESRGFRDGYANVSFSGHRSAHEWKVGADAVFSNLRERFAYLITDPSHFEPGTPLAYRFSGKGIDREQSAYAQDLWRLGKLTLSGGLRFDHYRLLVKDSAWSPRLGAAYSFPKLGLVVRGSYDRVFQTPASEGLLVSSAPDVQHLGDGVLSLPVHPSRGNYYQAGFARSLLGRLRLEGAWYLRDLGNFADDDLLLNTGVSFPIAFSTARVQGYEVKVEAPPWGRFSGMVAYSNMKGTGRLPITGGLFLDPNAAALLESTDRFILSQDQRNTVHGRIRVQAVSRLWFAVAGAYGSGLPVELENPDVGFLQAQYGGRVVDRVNFGRGRIRPSFTLDASIGADVLRREHFLIRVQADAFNITDHLNLINFDGLFSGTAIGRPRSYGVRAGFEF